MKNQLTEHFSLDELIRSNTATTRGICNMPYQAAIDNLQNLCQRVLEPLRQWAGVPDIATGKRWFDWIRKHCPFDQLIWEHASGKTWIHVSCCRNEDKNRKQVIQ